MSTREDGMTAPSWADVWRRRAEAWKEIAQRNAALLNSRQPLVEVHKAAADESRRRAEAFEREREEAREAADVALAELNGLTSAALDEHERACLDAAVAALNQTRRPDER